MSVAGLSYDEVLALYGTYDGILGVEGSVPTSADLPAGAAVDDAYQTEDTGHVWVWNGTSWVDTGPPATSYDELLAMPLLPGPLVRGGVFTVPSSPGPVTITGIGFRPQVVLFWGSNESTEDSILVGSASALMHGVMARDKLTGLIVSWCSSAVPHDSMRWEQKPIVCCLDGGSGTDYQADAVSLGSDGFSLNFTIAPAGTRKIHYVALGGMRQTFAKIIGSNFGGTTASVALGWRPQSALAINGLDDTIQDVAGPNREASIWGHMLSWGGKAFYSDNNLSWRSMYLEAIDTPFSDQDELAIQRYTGSTSWLGEGGHFLGPFLVAHAIDATLSGTGLQTINLDTGLDYQGHFTALDAFSETGNVTPANAVDGEADALSAIPEVQLPSLIIFYGALGRESSADGWPSSFCMGFWTPDHQYGVAANGADGSFYQSAVNGFIDRLTASGVHAGEIAPKSDGGATFTTKLASAASGARLVWHMFGTPLLSPWIPSIYRRIRSI